MIAAFGMYDRAETAAANDALWALMRDGLRAAGLAAPEALTRGDLAYMAGWQSPDLLISQTCSLPYRTALAGRVQIIAAPDYGLVGCPAGHYRSVYVARKSDGFENLAEVAGRRFAYNEALSHSGWAAPYADHLAQGLPLAAALRTGGHRASLAAVAEGRADYAAIDALTWSMAQRWDQLTAQLVAIGHTPPSPALPYITAEGQNPARLRAALAHAIAALPEHHCQTLSLRGLVDIPAADYLALAIPPPPQESP